MDILLLNIKSSFMSCILLYICMCVRVCVHIYTRIYIYFYYFKQIYDYKNKFPTYADICFRFTLLFVWKTACRIIMQIYEF